ncbi:S-methyl-5-thioribose kinase [Radiobacillus kanasensis]|uniref:S-methyl-5-thioribose kinase n=1 Tax=Radiobacillus kanasensis TaxID=2844358 RepID=UPI001E38E305|nr:S-methyl-5-thioribose kinase [Radiobacillus kanasensis]UFT98638.1 S-methyl-5-thioribose kinase [Radiobacillus kanasensis]
MLDKALTKEDVNRYVKGNPSLFSKHTDVTCKEIGDGNMNYVFRVHDRGNEADSVVIKQALPYMRSVGPTWPLSSERIFVEYKALKLQKKICPELVPDVYLFDEEMSLFFMEDLSTFHSLRDGLIDKQTYGNLAEHLGTFLARMLFFTSEFGASLKERQKFQEQFENKSMCQISQDFIFTYPFMEHEMNRYNPNLENIVQALYRDTSLQEELDNLKTLFMTKKQAVLHGDLHTGSVLVSNKQTMIIDAEFAFYGPIGFDMGLFFANVLLNYSVHWQNKQTAYCEYLLQVIRSVWVHFDHTFHRLTSNSDQKEFLTTIFDDSLGFAGCEMMRRILGTSNVTDIENIEDQKIRTVVETFALKLGKHLAVDRHQLKDINQLILSVQNLSSKQLL